MKIKDILQVNLEEDIKSVIDLEDHSEQLILSEIDSYIVTDNIGMYYSEFAKVYSSNIKETGVWISGFYGSGKSYFGKMLGYLLENKTIGGTPFADRFKQRFIGIKDESLIINDLGVLQKYKTKVIFLDIAKQNTTNGLAYTLFRGFLKNLDFLDNEYGIIEYELFIAGEYSKFLDQVEKTSGRSWKEIRKSMLDVEPGVKKALLGWKYSEDEYKNTIIYIQNTVTDFSSSRLKDMLAKYTEKYPDEKIVFLFDEASEALNQKKFSLIDLEDLSESLSSLGQKVWTVAIAQEKLDDVINNSNVTSSLLTKVTDRFKTKIHLEATEVDVIIKQRLLGKKEAEYNKLTAYYSKHKGKITDFTGLNAAGIEKTDDENAFAVYYPFHKYQFSLLQNFLFGTKGLATTKIAARGMIITTFDVLRKRLMGEELYNTASAHAICAEAQPQPPALLVNRYDNARRIIEEQNIKLNGRNLLETIHFLSEAEIVPVTIENITKAFVANAEHYHETYENIRFALDILVKSRILLVNNNLYKITSDLEQRLIDEMAGYPVELFVKRKYLVDILKKISTIKDLAKIQYNGQQYDFSVVSENDDEIAGSSIKYTRVVLYNLYNVDGTDSAFVEKIKTATKDDRGIITVIPDTSSFQEADECVVQIKRISYLEDRHGSSSDSDVKKIVRDFLAIRDEKEKRLYELVEDAYRKSSIINLYNVYRPGEAAFVSSMKERQSKVIDNIYTRRIASQLGDSVAVQVIKETRPAQLHKYFSGDDFAFFDSAGNFIGEGLKSAEEILSKTRNTFVEGKTLESDLAQPPTGFTYGTVASTTAALFRAGKIIARFNGEEKFTYSDHGASLIFDSSRNFGKASFKAVSRALTAEQKKVIVDALLDINYKDVMGQAIDYNSSDYELAISVKKLADTYISRVDAHRKTVKDFDSLFGNVHNNREALAEFVGTVNDSNYIERAEYFIANLAVYREAVKAITKAETFLRNNLDKIQTYKRFAEDLRVDYNKCEDLPESFRELYTSFHEIMKEDIVARFSDIQAITQKMKDQYYDLMQSANKEMSEKHTDLKKKAQSLVNEIEKYPPELNSAVLERAKKFVDYADKRINKEINLSYDVRCANCGLTLSEMKNAIALVQNQTDSMMFIRYDIKTEAAEEEKGIKKTITHHPLPRLMKAGEYRKILNAQLTFIKDVKDDEEIAIEYKE